MFFQNNAVKVFNKRKMSISKFLFENSNKPAKNSEIYNMLKTFIFEASSINPIIALGIPKVVAQLLSNRFGNKAFIISKWYKEYVTNGIQNAENGWWRKRNRTFSGKIDLAGYVEIYNASTESPEALLDTLKKYKFVKEYDDTLPTKEKMKIYKEASFEEIKKETFNDTFFDHELIKKIMSNEITDLKPYKGLTFFAAQDKYDEKRLFGEDIGQVVKQYSNGWKWINAGKKCELVGKQMKNCGSAGVLSYDPDRTIMTLFNPNNEAKVVVTYSPNDRKLSYAEGQAGSEPKDIYHDYILDLEDILGVKYDFFNGHRTPELSLKSRFKSIAKVNLVIPPKDKSDLLRDQFFELTFNNGKKYITDSFVAYDFTDVNSLFKKQREFKDFYLFLARVIFDSYSKQHDLKKFRIETLAEIANAE